MQVVQDIINSNLRILFIGFNPGLRSAETGQHFAGHSNRFWRLLAESGLTSRQLRPDEADELLCFGYGITNIVDRSSKTAAEITKQEYQVGKAMLQHKLAIYRPKIACYTGIGVYREFSSAKKICCGLQSNSSVQGIIDFVVPSPSGLNRITFGEQLNWYRKLKQIASSGLLLFTFLANVRILFL